eukprot:TRINITY_DN885_c0_g1_i1.p1 TRINITY_DN885_c0_g1~~TRINITY_DN885_c0_g1_i1.p1  ORF type:complete len:489 (+),score=111.24 TRINITY_DN885_c0_g1_i1:201-1667(+)
MCIRDRSQAIQNESGNNFSRQVINQPIINIPNPYLNTPSRSPVVLPQNNQQVIVQPPRSWVQYQPNPIQKQAELDDMINNYSQSQKVQLDINQKKNDVINELEQHLEQEKQRTKQIRQAMELELQEERKNKIEFENKMKMFRDESVMREHTIKELEQRLDVSQQEHQKLLQAFNELKEQLVRSRDETNGKFLEYEEVIKNLTREKQKQDDKYKLEIERLTNENTLNLDSLNRQWDFKYKSLEEKCRHILEVKDGIEKELKNMDDYIMKMKIDQEEQIKQKAVKIAQDEHKKYISTLKTLEMKLRSSEEANANLNKKYTDQTVELEQKDAQCRDMNAQIENIANSLKQENLELQNQINHLSILRENNEQEIAEKENNSRNLQSELIETKRNTQAITDKQLDEFMKKELALKEELKTLETIRDQQAKKIKELETVISQMEGEMERLQLEQNKLNQNLQQNIQNAIHKTVIQQQSVDRNVDKPSQQTLKYL